MESNIFGTEYSIFVTNNLPDDCDGITDYYEKQIKVREKAKLLDHLDENWKKDERSRENMRHELLHAALYECGLVEYAFDEIIVSWLAVQFPKLCKLFGGLECID